MFYAFITSLTSNSSFVSKSPPKTFIQISYLINIILKKFGDFWHALTWTVFPLHLVLSSHPEFSLHHHGGGYPCVGPFASYILCCAPSFAGTYLPIASWEKVNGRKMLRPYIPKSNFILFWHLIVWLGTIFLVINNFPSGFLRYYLIFFSHFSACLSAPLPGSPPTQIPLLTLLEL